MKKIFVISLCLIAAVCTQSFAQDGGQFKFDGGDTWDFGVIPRGPIAKHEFTFTNIGNRPLNIVDVTPSCGCTGVDWPKKPIMPGEKGTISLGLKTIEQHGVFDKEVYIKSDAVKIPHGDKRYTIYIKGDAKGDDPKDAKP